MAEENDSMSKIQFSWLNDKSNVVLFFICFFLSLCCLFLGLIAIRMTDISQWANYQSICIEEISKTYPTEYAVRKCNGRSKIYIPKV